MGDKNPKKAPKMKNDKKSSTQSGSAASGSTKKQK
jgi:hypothetical protein